MKLTKGQREVLELMNHPLEEPDDEYYTELVYEKGVCYLGDARVDPRILFGLVKLCAISLDQYSTVGEFERYYINDTGRELLNEK